MDFLFDAFDDDDGPPRPPALPPLPAAPTSSPAVSADSKLPPAFSHLQHEAIASIAFHAMEEEDRHRLERVMRECTAQHRSKASPPIDVAKAPHSAGTAAAGFVHYFRKRMLNCPSLSVGGACPPSSFA